MIPFCETPFHPEYARLGAIVGKGKIKSEHWDSWARLVDKFSWSVVLRAADRVDALNRWPATIEAMCTALVQESADEERAVKERERIAAIPKPKNPQESSKLFASIREKYGV